MIRDRDVTEALRELAVRDVYPVAGGDISQAFRARCDRGDCFIKCVEGGAQRMLPCEAAGLTAMRETFDGVVPDVFFVDSRFLVLEWLDLRPRGDTADAALGRNLARMHASHGSAHGWPEDNFIGRTPQQNLPRSESWVDFFIHCRLKPHLQGLIDSGCSEFSEFVDPVCDLADQLLRQHCPPPSLLHGDLWGGNAAAMPDHRPVLFDPACSYGDRETDLAMCRLFGGFSSRFFRAYEQSNPLPADWPDRVSLYQLYHILNHARLFGGSWQIRALNAVQSLLKTAL